MHKGLTRSSGFSLMEVLITVLILSIGLLGLAGLQTAGVRSNHRAYQRSQVTMLGYDILDRMRVNRQQALNGDYEIAIGTDPTANGIVQLDLVDWKNTLASRLPGGDGAVQCFPSALPAPLPALLPDECLVTVQWSDWDEIAGDRIARQLTMRARL